MGKLIVAIVASLIVGFAAAGLLGTALVFNAPGAPGPVEPGGPADPAFDPNRPVEERIRALEKALMQERQARQLLEEEVIFLTREIERLDGGADDAPQPASSAEEDLPPVVRSRRIETREGQVDRLVAAGFPVSRAEWIVQREAELQLERLNARFEAMRSSGEPGFFGAIPGNELRAELGDRDYERYLEAYGRPTSVSVNDVLPNSPAQQSGLQPGDRIIRYDGERVYSMMDLAGQIMRGDIEGNVIVDITRGDVPMQLVLPRGPLGVMGN